MIIIPVAVAVTLAILLAICIILLVVGLLIINKRRAKSIETISERNYVSDETMRSLQGGPVYEELNLKGMACTESQSKTVHNTMYEEFRLESNKGNTYQLCMDRESQAKTVHNELYEEFRLE